MTFQKYLGDSKMFEYDKYYRECRQLNKPFIKSRINPKQEFYYVTIDLITCDYNLTNQEIDEIKKLIQNEIKYVKENSRYVFHDFHIDKELAWFDGVSPEHMNNFCENLFDITQKFHA